MVECTAQQLGASLEHVLPIGSPGILDLGSPHASYTFLYSLTRLHSLPNVTMAADARAEDLYERVHFAQRLALAAHLFGEHYCRNTQSTSHPGHVWWYLRLLTKAACLIANLSVM